MPEVGAYHICPKCSSEEIQRIPRKHVVDHLARAMGWHVYRCLECGGRFYDRPAQPKAS
jgi:uncharacterized Zn finger protein